MFNYSDTIQKDPSTIKVLLFVSFEQDSFVIRLQQQFLGDICYYFRSLSYAAVGRSRPY